MSVFSAVLGHDEITGHSITMQYDTESQHCQLFSEDHGATQGELDEAVFEFNRAWRSMSIDPAYRIDQSYAQAVHDPQGLGSTDYTFGLIFGPDEFALLCDYNAMMWLTKHINLAPHLLLWFESSIWLFTEVN